MQNLRAMAAPPIGTPPLSPDGNYWWDGRAWQPMPFPAAAAPVPPAPAPVPAAGQPTWLDQPLPASFAAGPPAPVADQPVYAAPAPAWSTPAPPQSRMWIYGTGILLMVVIGIGGYAAYGALKAPDNAAAVQVTPSPVISDYERADRFLNVDLGPALVETNQAMPAITKNCTSSLPPPCRDALVTLNKAMIDLNTAMANNQRDIPVCIGRQVQQFKDDWNGMEQGISQAIGGFDAGNRTLILEGLQKFAALAQYLKPDVDRINTAMKACSKTV